MTSRLAGLSLRRARTLWSADLHQPQGRSQMTTACERLDASSELQQPSVRPDSADPASAAAPTAAPVSGAVPVPVSGSIPVPVVDRIGERPSAKFVLTLGALIAIGPLTIDMYMPSLPSITSDLGTTSAAVQLTLTGTLVGMAVGQLLIGP